MIQKAAAMGNWWLTASSQQCIQCIMYAMHERQHHVSFRVFWGKYQITWVTQSPHSPDLAPCNFWLFPKLKSSLKGKRFQIIGEIQENTTGELTLNWEHCMRFQGAYFEGAWGIIILYTMFLVSSSVSVSIFHITWLHTFWKDLIYTNCKYICTQHRNT